MSNVAMTGFFTVGDDPATDVDIYIIGRTSKITNKSPLIRGFRLLDSEKEALTAFLQSLSDQDMLRDSRLERT